MKTSFFALKALGLTAACFLTNVLFSETASSVAFRFDVEDRSNMPPTGGFAFDPTVQGWLPLEVTAPGSDADGDGRIDLANNGPLFDSAGEVEAWQVIDQLASGANNLPTYNQPLSPSDYQAFYDEGWEFEFTVRTGGTITVTQTSVPGTTVRAAFVGWTVQAGNDPGWRLAENGYAAGRVGFWVGNDTQMLPDGNLTQKFWLETPSLERIVLEAGSADAFQTIRCVGLPESSVYDWYLNGVYMGTLDFLDSDLNSGSFLRFGAGSSSGIGGTTDWKRVYLASCPPPAPAPSGQAIIQGQVQFMDSELCFIFESTFPAGTNFQPQYSATLAADWVDLPDARIVELAAIGDVRRYEVFAPQFGSEKGFYRVVAAQQASEEAPIGDTRDSDPPEPEEQLLLFSAQPGGASNGSTFFESQVLGFLEDGPEPGFFTRLRSEVGASATAFSNPNMRDHIALDLDGSGLPRPIFCWPDENGQLQLIVRDVPQSGTSWPDGMHVYPLLGTEATLNSRGIIRLVGAQLDNDPEMELVVAWSGPSDRIHLLPVDFNGDYQSPPSVGAENSSTELYGFTNSGRFDQIITFDLVVGNFVETFDGRDEVAIVYTSDGISGSDDYTVVARFFDASASGLTLNTDLGGGDFRVFGADLDSPSGEGRYSLMLVGLAADIECDGQDELHVGIRQSFPGGLDTPYSLFAIRTPTIAGGSMGIGPRFFYADSPAIGKGLALASVNVDENSTPELLFAGLREYFLKPRADLSFENLGQSSSAPAAALFGRRDLTVIDFNGVQRAVIVNRELFGAPADRRRILISTYDIVRSGATLDLVEFSEREISTGNVDDEAVLFGVMTAPFTPLDLKLGVPRRFETIVANQPTVVLNAPPVHFDVLGGTVFDVNDFFPVTSANQGDPFTATYQTETSNTITVTSEWRRSWDVSTQVSGGFNLGPIGVQAAITTTFGEDFENATSSFESTVVQTQINAASIDRIYATTLNYVIWEYPVLLDDEIVGHIVLTSPSVSQNSWSDIKSPAAQNYRPYHETGNVMSYRNSLTGTGIALADLVRPLESGDAFTVSAAPGAQTWKLTRTTGSTTSQSRAFNFRVNAEASFAIPFPFVPNVDLNGGYGSNNLRASESVLEDSEGLSVTLGSLDGSIAGTAYAVTPYLYWDRSGAVVLDYTVQPFSGTASNPTFWGQNYGLLPDPAFVLPFRYDPEKGLALILDRLRQQTREITTLPPRPRPGQDVKVAARIANFSFQPVSGSLVVDFYYGDPASNGTLIHTEIVPAGTLDGQDRHIIEFPWTVPADLETNSFEIHAVIDPLDEREEIHNDNNQGWTEVFLRRGP